MKNGTKQKDGTWKDDNGLHHRLDGPASIHFEDSYGYSHYFLHGKLFAYKDWLKQPEVKMFELAKRMKNISDVET